MRPHTMTFRTSFLRYSTAGQTMYLLRQPSPSAPREVPTPLVFVSSSQWDASSAEGMRKFAGLFAERGYTCLEIDLAVPQDRSSGDALMQHFEAELASHVRLAAIPFAPVVIARSTGSLIAQTYISSHPASGLLLISPPESNAAVSSSGLLPSPIPEFNFETKFPLAILCTEDDKKKLAENRLWNDDNVDKLVVKDHAAIDGQKGRMKIETWLDEIGV